MIVVALMLAVSFALFCRLFFREAGAAEPNGPVMLLSLVALTINAFVLASQLEKVL